MPVFPCSPKPHPPHHVTHKSISQETRFHLTTLYDDDGVLDRLKFINKGEEYKVYGKPIPSTLVTNDIQNSKAYKTFIGISTGLIPLKKGRGKGAQGTKVLFFPKKATSASKRKRKRKEGSIRDESMMKNQRNKEERIVREPSLVLRPEVPDEPQGILQTQMKELTFLFDVKEENPEDILWVSIDEDESDDDDEEDDESIDTESTDDEKSDTNVEDQVKGVAKINIDEESEEEKAEKVEEQKADEELKADEEE
ncbi:hypothetical protein Tco_0559728 [Tanacetum coccineum]